MQERGKNYKIWFDNADPLYEKPNEEIIDANMYARTLKEKTVEK